MTVRLGGVARGLIGALALAIVLVGPARASVPEDPPGTQRWASRYGTPGAFDDGGMSIASSPDGSRVFVTGFTGGFLSSHNDYATIAYSTANGSELWLATYDGPGPDVYDNDYATSIAVSPDGATVFVTGASVGIDSTYGYTTIAYAAADGAELWTARYDGPLSDDRAVALGLSPDGTTVYVTGLSQSGIGDYATLAYAATDGAQLWVARYDGSNSDDRPTALGVSADGTKIFVTGERHGAGNDYDYATVAYSAADGSELWAVRYDGPTNGDDHATSLGASPDGSTVVVTGYSLSVYYDYATVAYAAASGAQLWAVRYSGAGRNNEATSTGVSPDGSTVFATGRSEDALGSNDYATVAYSAATGAQVWVSRFDGSRVSVGGVHGLGGRDAAQALKTSPDGSAVFVTGMSEGRTVDNFPVWDYATVAYSAASGAALWVSRYNGTSNTSDTPTSLAVSPDGSAVFVTGYSTGSDGSNDFATVAYQTTSCGHPEAGPVSEPVHGIVEPLAGPAAPYIHGVNCDVVAAVDL